MLLKPIPRIGLALIMWLATRHESRRPCTDASSALVMLLRRSMYSGGANRKARPPTSTMPTSAGIFHLVFHAMDSITTTMARKPPRELVDMIVSMFRKKAPRSAYLKKRPKRKSETQPDMYQRKPR